MSVLSVRRGARGVGRCGTDFGSVQRQNNGCVKLSYIRMRVLRTTATQRSSCKGSLSVLNVRRGARGVGWCGAEAWKDKKVATKVA